MRSSLLRRPVPYALFFACLIAVGLWVPRSGQAQGFGIYEQGSCAMARAGAAVANGCGDGSSIYFNPAHVMDADGVTASVGASVIVASGEFTYDHAARPPYTGAAVDLDNDPITVPQGYVTYGLSDRFGIGLGAYVPYGLETNWPVQLADGSVFDGAFEGFKSRIQNIYIQPTLAYQVTPKLRVGAGAILAVSSVELRQVLDLSLQSTPGDGPTFGQLGVPFHTAFARAGLESTGELGVGANVGVSYRANDRLSVGLRFTSPVTISYEGDASFTQLQTGLTFPETSPLAQDLTGDGTPDPTPADLLLAGQFDEEGVLDTFSGQASSNGTLGTQTVETELTFPFQLVGGVSMQATEKLLLLADYQFTGWAAFEEIPLTFERLGKRVREQNYDNTHAVRLGAEYDLLDQLTARLGYLYNTAAAPDDVVTPLLPESDRNQFTIGVGWRPIERAEIDVSYQLLRQNDRRGRVRGPRPGESLSTELNQGLYSFGAHLFGTTLTLYL